MIVKLFLDIIFSIINILIYPINLLPDASLDSSFMLAIHQASSYLYPLDKIVPLNIVFSILSIYIIIEGAYLLYKLIMWVIKRLPTQS